MNDIDHDAILHFVRLARRGAHPAASGGEQVANKLAKALHKIGDDLMLLDGDARQGAAGLLILMGGPFRTAENKQSIYAMVKQAAGK